MYEDIASSIIDICEDIAGDGSDYPLTEQLADSIATFYANYRRDPDCERACSFAAELIPLEAPFREISQICQGIENGHVGWSAEASDGNRMPEHIASILMDGDYFYYMEHFSNNVPLDAGDDLLACVDEVLAAKQEILTVLEPLMGKYGAY